MIPLKVQHLVRLAAGASSEHEADCARRMACKLILGLIGLDSQKNESRNPAESETIDRLRRDIERLQGELRGTRAARNVPPNTEQLERLLRDRDSEIRALRKQLLKTKEPPRVIRAKFESLCRDCGETIEKDEKCWWQPNVKGCVCSDCHG